MEDKKTTQAVELLKELKPCMDKQVEQEWIAKAKEAGFDEETARVILEAYNKGCNEYNWRAWNAEGKYTKLCIAVCEKFIVK
jgi:hypothetical protein